MFGSGPKVSRVGRSGIIKWEINCPEKGCSHRVREDDKGRAKREYARHDKNVHAPKRRAAAKAEKTLRAKQAKELAAAERKAEVAAARKAGRKANEAAKEADDNRGWRTSRPRSGLHTKGIPGVPDGQNVNGKVYYAPDENGKRKPVPYHVLKKHVQGWDD
jgi:hypothetical protein